MKGYCDLKAVPMRSEPSDRAEMVNQLVMGDCADVVERQEKWSLVASHYDGYRGWVDNKQLVFFDGTAADLAVQWLMGTPYLWGGRSAGGVDCSGLTQLCFKALGIWLPRDAQQQATCGVEACLCDAQRDDLAFFQNAEGRVVHVGICLGDGHIVHASGYVRVDRLDSQGIYDERLSLYTHRLHSLRRIAHPQA